METEIFKEGKRMFKSCKNKMNVCRGILFLGLFLCVIAAPMIKKALADEDAFVPKEYPQGKVFQLHKKESSYSYSESNLLKDGERLPFGRKYAGDFYLTGDNIQPKKRLNGQGYSTGGKIIFNYSYNGSLNDRDKKEWQLYDDGQNKVKDIQLNRDVEMGAVIIQKSFDNASWNTEDYYTNFFEKHPTGMKGIYEANEEDVKRGAYYKVIVAYTIRKYMDSHWIDPLGVVGTITDDYDYEECIEEYYFYVCLDGSSLHVREIYTGEDITSESITTVNGFSVISDADYSKISVKRPSDSSLLSVPQYSTYTEKGEYKIQLETPFGEKIDYKVFITKGVDMAEVESTVYDANSSYRELTAITSGSGLSQMTKLFVLQQEGYTIKKAKKGDWVAYSVDGEGVALYLQLNYGTNLGSGWNLVDDSYGSKDGQELFGVKTGEIASGALVVQTSLDGVNWNTPEKGRYESGLYTTDFSREYGKGKRIDDAAGKRILIYSPDGQSVLNGLYIRVIYAYKVKKSSDTKNIVEEYEFYLSNSNTDAVVFHNLTLEDKLDQFFEDEDETTIEIYREAETLESNTQTLAGFRIDTKNNPTVEYEVKKDGRTQVKSGTYTDSGRYDITLKAIGETKTVTIFVDRYSMEDTLKLYFGDGFLVGKRIFAEEELPVYIANETEYHVSAVSDTLSPLSGVIRNKQTGTEITISPTRFEKKGKLSEPGEYEAIFFTNSTFTSDAPVGDAKVITFRFFVWPQTANPGPVVNQHNLEEYAKSNVSDLRPKYYGATYPSAGKGHITFAFATEQEAYDFAYAYEKGLAEDRNDGTYLYKDRDSVGTTKKVVYNSYVELTEAFEYFAKEAVKVGFFDMSDRYTYLTLADDISLDLGYLQQQMFANSIVVFVDESQREKLLATEGLPIIGPKKSASIAPGKDAKLKEGVASDFKFIKDDNGYDSENVDITASDGNRYTIEYQKEVGAQLEDKGCASGTIRIFETNKYKDQTEYKAVFLRKDENLATVKIRLFDGNQYHEEEINQTVAKDDEKRFFSAVSFELLSISDETDCYSFLRITRNGEPQPRYYAAEDISNVVFSEAGDYTVRCLNRMGYYFEFEVSVISQDSLAFVQCSDGIGNIQEIVTSHGKCDVKLPEIIRKGYVLKGYIDKKGSDPIMSIAEVDFVGKKTYEAVWEPIDCRVVIVNQDEVTIKELFAKYDETIDLISECHALGLEPTIITAGDRVISDGKLLVNEDNIKVVVIASIVAPKDASSQSTASNWMLIGISVCALAVVCVVLLKRRKREHEEK